MFTTKTTFNPEDCYISVQTHHLTRFNQLDNPFMDQIAIELRDANDKYIANVTVMRIPSHQRKNACELYGVWYNMADFMHNENEVLSAIADEMELSRTFSPTGCRTGLDANDLYQVVVLFVVPEYRKMGIGTWLLSNLQMMLSRITHDREPVCVLYPPKDIENGRVLFDVEHSGKVLCGVGPWVMDLYKKTGWTPVKDGAYTLYYH